MAVAVPDAAVDATVASLAARGLPAARIGEVVDAATLGGRRYVEEASA
jgi:hypothetical protein